MRAFLRFFGSYIVAILLMLTLGIVLAVGTFYESTISTEAAQQMIYKTRWFVGILGLLFLNILFSTLKRWPFKKHHTGFVITHLGLLVLLAGAMISKTWGIEGDLILEEGQSASEFEMKIEALRIEGDQTSALFKKRFTDHVNGKPWRKALGSTTQPLARRLSGGADKHGSFQFV